TVARLTQDSLRRGVESKLDADAMLGFLADHSSTPIPQTVQHFVRDVAGTYGQVQIGPAEFYLRANSPQLMQKILSTRAAANLLQPLTDTVALVDARDRAKLVTILRQGGHMPLVLEPEAPASQSLPVQLATLNDVRRPVTSTLPAPDWDHLRELERYQQPAMPPPAPPRRDGPRQEPLFQRSGFGTPSGDSVA
ncbi:MAG: helicase-associated domain-containing protein, partial [Chloroflexota bacterium]